MCEISTLSSKGSAGILDIKAGQLKTSASKVAEPSIGIFHDVS